jgi:chromosome segregation ATPase
MRFVTKFFDAAWWANRCREESIAHEKTKDLRELSERGRVDAMRALRVTREKLAAAEHACGMAAHYQRGAEERINGLELHVNELAADLRDSKAALAETSARLGSVDVACEAIRAQRDAAEATLDEVNAAVERACDALYQTGATRGGVDVRALRAKETYHRLISENADLEDELDVTHEHLSEAAGALVDLLLALRAHGIEPEHLERELAGLKSDVRAAEAEVERLQPLLKTTRAAHEQSERERDAWLAEVAKQRETIVAGRQELARAIAAKDQQIAELERKLAAAQSNTAWTEARAR